MTSEGTDAAAAVPVDTTGDGIADSMGYDTTGDGKIDAVDQNGDGKIDYTFGSSFASIGSIMNPTPNPEVPVVEASVGVMVGDMPDVAGQITKLADLHAQGILSDSDFAAA